MGRDSERSLATQIESPSGQIGGECVHHWLIETPIGAMSKGYCKKCREVRVDFPNSFDAREILAYFRDPRPEMFIKATGISEPYRDRTSKTQHK